MSSPSLADKKGEVPRYMISIRKYLEMYRRSQGAIDDAEAEGGVALAEDDLRPALANLAAALVAEIGTGRLPQDDPAYEPLGAAVEGIRRRLEEAEAPEEIEAIAADVRALFEDVRRCEQAAERNETAEVQKMVAMLQETIEALSRGSERSVSRLRRIESQVRSASQLSEIVALRERLRVCVDQIRDEAAAEQREFAKTKSELERSFLMAQESVALARGGVPGRSQAEQRLAEAAGDSPWAAILLERLAVIKSRYGPGVAERYFSSFLTEVLGRLPAPRLVFRWDARTVLVEIQGGGPADVMLRSGLAAMPRSAQVDVGGRVAVLENTHRWCLIPAGTRPEAAMARIEEFAGV
ncbi:MAG TPA: hypothetical protein VMU19_07895 [Bryobacteraceae bacterium]|nr:hypothetical protein [Bryobacteraceae bacterium]